MVEQKVLNTRFSRSSGMSDPEFSAKDAANEQRLIKKITSAKADVKRTAIAMVKHLESTEVPDEKDLEAIHKRLVREEKSLAKLLRPATRSKLLTVRQQPKKKLKKNK